ncbi:hypothetical protein ANO11243_046910 [Dothideomycetidae sp. 11243]|nr:hypothetical protein ANO11243_046910 [fungal sp. No.11243]
MQSAANSQQQSQRLTHSSDALRNTSSAYDRTRSEESWVEIASQPSSSSLSSAADEIVTTGLRVQEIARRRRRPRSGLVPSQVLRVARSSGDISSQEEYEESESESDRVMTSSNEGLVLRVGEEHPDHEHDASLSDEDESRTAVNYPIRPTAANASAFTPQPNAFSHPPQSYTIRHASEPSPGSYFPQMPVRSDQRPVVRHSFSTQDTRPRHLPHAPGSHSQSAAAHHDAALRASLSTLLSCAAAARGLPKSRSPQPSPQLSRPSNRVDIGTLRLIPESALPGAQANNATNTMDPLFPPTLRQRSSSSTSGSPEPLDVNKRKGTRGSSRERRVSKKARRSSSASSASTAYGTDDMLVSPTLLTWVLSAGVVVALSAISFSAGYSIGREAGMVEASLGGVGASDVGSCASEAGRSGMGLRRLRFTAQA